MIKRMMMMFLLFSILFSLVVRAEEIDFKKLEQISKKYTQSQHRQKVLMAIAEIESQNGTILGQYVVQEVVSEHQKKYLNKIASRLQTDPENFRGSYAGAMGLMQIIPSTFWLYGQDGDADGLKDPMNPYDSFATAAYYLEWHSKKKGSTQKAIFAYNRSDIYVKKVLKIASSK